MIYFPFFQFQEPRNHGNFKIILNFIIIMHIVNILPIWLDSYHFRTQFLYHTMILYYFNQFISHASQVFQNQWNVMIVMVIWASDKTVFRFENFSYYYLHSTCHWLFYIYIKNNCLMKILQLSCSPQQPDKNIFLSGVSQVMVPDELIKMVQ